MTLTLSSRGRCLNSFSRRHLSLSQLTTRGCYRACAVTYKYKTCLTTRSVPVKKWHLRLLLDTSRLAVVELNSFIGGYHAYKDMWTPFIGEGLLLRREPENVKNRAAVSVLKDGETVGHILFNIYNAVSNFLRIEFNKGFAEVTGEKVNRGAGYGFLYTQALRATAFRYVRYFDHYSSSPKKYFTLTSSLCMVLYSKT